MGTVIQLQGDKRKDVAKFLLEEGIATKEEIKIHGYWVYNINIINSSNTLLPANYSDIMSINSSPYAYH